MWPIHTAANKKKSYYYAEKSRYGFKRVFMGRFGQNDCIFATSQTKMNDMI